MRIRRLSLSLFMLPVLFAIGCGDDSPTDPGNGNGGGGGTSAPVSAYSADVEAVVGTYLDANAAAYQSLSALGPSIRTALSAGSGPLATIGTAQASCLPPEIVGVTFEWDGAMYVAGPDPGAPSDGARFLLYQLHPTTLEPDTNNVIGHLDASCSVISSVSYSVNISVVVGGVTIFQQVGTATENPPIGYLTIQGYLGAVGAANLETFIEASTNSSNGTALLSTGFELASRDISFGVTVRDTAGINRREMLSGAAKGYTTALQWIVNVHARADLLENIENGAAYLDLYGTSSTGIQLVACLTGGTLSEPTLAGPDASCDTWLGGAPVGTSTEADRLAAAAAYARLYALHVSVRQVIVDIFGLGT